MHLTAQFLKRGTATRLTSWTAVGLLTLACAKLPDKKAMITEPQAVELAKAAFTKAGHQVSDYDVSVEHDAGAKRWMVWFDRKGPFRVPGGRHYVKVDENTGEAVFAAGQ